MTTFSLKNTRICYNTTDHIRQQTSYDQQSPLVLPNTLMQSDQRYSDIKPQERVKLQKICITVNHSNCRYIISFP